MSDGLGTDCRKLIVSKLEGRITIQDYIAEIWLLNVKYPGIGFDESARNLENWLLDFP